MSKPVKHRIEDWYYGPLLPNDPSSALVFINHHNPHWTARIAQALVSFWLAHWQWTIGTAVAISGLWIALNRT